MAKPPGELQIVTYETAPTFPMGVRAIPPYPDVAVLNDAKAGIVVTETSNVAGVQDLEIQTDPQVDRVRLAQKLVDVYGAQLVEQQKPAVEAAPRGLFGLRALWGRLRRTSVSVGQVDNAQAATELTDVAPRVFLASDYRQLQAMLISELMRRAEALDRAMDRVAVQEERTLDTIRRLAGATQATAALSRLGSRYL